MTEVQLKKLADAKEARLGLQKVECFSVGRLSPKKTNGFYLENYANCLLNRQIDIFDDAIYLLEGGRVASACAISRGMIETYAFAFYLGDKISKILNKSNGAVDGKLCLDVILKFTNSSKFKVKEQEKLKNNVFNLDSYSFTEEARARMMGMLARNQHVLDALRCIFQIKNANELESWVEILYDGLSEWVHPSQTSVFHNYVPQVQWIQTSIGKIHLYEAAKGLCVDALHFITDSESVHRYLLDMANEIDDRQK